MDDAWFGPGKKGLPPKRSDRAVAKVDLHKLAQDAARPASLSEADWSAICSIVTMIDSAMRAPHSGFRNEQMQSALQIARDRYEHVRSESAK